MDLTPEPEQRMVRKRDSRAKHAEPGARHVERIYGFLVELMGRTEPMNCTCPPGHDVCAMRAALFEAAAVMAENDEHNAAVMLIAAFSDFIEADRPTEIFLESLVTPFMRRVLDTMRKEGKL